MSSTPTKSRRKKYEYDKIYGSPEAKIQQLAEDHGILQFKAELKRRWPDGGIKGIQTFPSVDGSFIMGMQNWVEQSGLGGGNFEVYVFNNLDPGKVLFMYAFELEGPPIEIKRMPKPSPFNGPGVQSWPSGQQGYVPPTQGWGPQISQPGMMPQQHWGMGPWAPRTEPRRDHRLEQKLDALERQNDMLQKQLVDQRHTEELRREREANAQQLREIRDGFQKQIDVLKDELKDSRKKEDGDGFSMQIFNMMQQSAQSQQSMMQMMMNREGEASREQLKAMKEQLLEDIKFRREMYDKIAEARDPKQAAALIDMMGQQTASMLNLLQQAVSSGLLGGQDGDPAWYRAVSQGLEGLKDFGTKVLQAKQQEAAMHGLGRMPQGPRPRLPVPRPGLGQAPQQPGTQMAPSPPAPTGPPRPPRAVPGQGDAEPTQQVLDAEEEEQQPPSLIVPIQNFVMAMQEDYQDPGHEHTRTVADMIFDFVVFLRNNNMMPPEWQGFFEDPGTTVGEFLRQFVEPVNPEMGSVSADYLQMLGDHIRDIIREEEGEEEIDDVEAVEKRVAPTPEPPAPPEQEGETGEQTELPTEPDPEHQPEPPAEA